MNIITRLTLTLSICFLFLPMFSVDAATPLGRYGWMTILSDIFGDDVSCGPGLVKQELYIRDIGTGNPVSVDSAIFTAQNQSDDAVVSQVTGTGPSVGTVCFNPDTQYLGMDIDGGADHYDFQLGIRWGNPEIIPRGKLMRTTVWLSPVSSPPPLEEYVQLSPVNTVTNVNPEYKINLSSLPSTYGASETSRISFGIFAYDPLSATIGTVPVVEQTYDVPGGVGVKTLPAQALPDGIYAWEFFVRLNGSHDAGGIISLRDLKSGYGVYNWPFTLDTTAPTLNSASAGISPTSPSPSDTITVTGNATDTLSGINTIEVYVDSALVHTCNFASTQSASCATSVGPYAASSTHQYYIKAYDAAGNVGTSNTSQFTISNPLPDLIVQSVSPTSGIAGFPIVFSAVIQNIGQATATGPFSNLFQIWDSRYEDGTTNVSTFQISSIPAGGSVTATATYTFPANLANTIQFVRWCPDHTTYNDVSGTGVGDAGVVSESNETNNCPYGTSWRSVRLTAPADFVAASATLSVAPVLAGDTVTIGTGNIVNQGGASVWRVPIDGFYIDANNDGVADYTATAGAIQKNHNIANGEISSTSVVWNVPANVPSGTYRVGYIISVPTGELNTSNNWSGWTPFTIVGNTPPNVSAGFDVSITLPTTSVQPRSGPPSDGGAYANDSDGSIANLSWSYISGPGPTPTITYANPPNYLLPTFGNLTSAGDYVFRLTAVDNSGATSTDDMTVTVNAALAVTGNIYANGVRGSTVIVPGDSVTLTWDSTNATSCTVAPTGWTGTSEALGQTDGPLMVSKIYGLTCDGVFVASVSALVNPDVTITAAKQVVENGGSVDISWDTNGNDEAMCSMSGGGLDNSVFDGSGSGAVSVGITARTTFRLNCGTQDDSVTVEIKPQGWET